VYTDNPEQTMQLGERIGKASTPALVIALRGGLGSGKTTLTKGIARALDVREELTSPTYTIISEYSGRLPLYHMDAYRLAGDDDFAAIGAEEYLYGDGLCVVEWSERVAASLPPDAVYIDLEIQEHGRRRFRIDGAPLEEALA